MVSDTKRSVVYSQRVAGGADRPRLMECEECGTHAIGDAWGWRGYRIDDPEDGDPPEIGFFCPDCAYREFGPLARPLRHRHALDGERLSDTQTASNAAVHPPVHTVLKTL